MAGLISSFASILFSSGRYQKLVDEKKVFSNVVGYSDIKRLLSLAVMSVDPVHILLTGPPSSCKTVFLLGMLDSVQDTYYVDAAGASGPGMIEHLFTSNTKYLLIDEIDKMKKGDQASLLNVMETGILSETKLKGKTRQKKLKLWIFATSNDIQMLSAPLRSRFMELHLPEYTFDEFLQITRSLLKKRYKLDTNMADRIGHSVWHTMKSKDVRDVTNIARLVRSSGDVDWLTQLQIKYAKGRYSDKQCGR